MKMLQAIIMRCDPPARETESGNAKGSFDFELVMMIMNE
jgi:hypothetical protein